MPYLIRTHSDWSIWSVNMKLWTFWRTFQNLRNHRRNWSEELLNLSKWISQIFSKHFYCCNCSSLHHSFQIRLENSNTGVRGPRNLGSHSLWSDRSDISQSENKPRLFPVQTEAFLHHFDQNLASLEKLFSNLWFPRFVTWCCHMAGTCHRD